MKALYQKFPYLFNLVVVLILLTVVRTIDSFAWVEPNPDRTRDILLNYLFEFVSFLPVILLMIYSYHQTVRRKQTVRLVFLIVVFSILGPTFIQLLSTALGRLFLPQAVAPFTFDLIYRYTPGAMLCIFFLTATYYLTYLLRQYNYQREATHRAETLGRESQLKMLHYQINPHFLFNVLNSIHALIDEDSAKAKKLVVEMSDYYRHTLNKLEQTITVGREVEAVVKYLEIQKIRFEENFKYELTLDDAARELQIPSFVIHLLVENAVKYGIRTSPAQLKIRLSVVKNDHLLTIKVLNTGRLNPGAPGQEGTGSGIDNIKSRLALYCNDHYSFSLIEEEGWVTATIEMEACKP